MIESMTGFTTSDIALPTPEHETAYLTISIKSLNSRFFETTCRLPYMLSSLETELIKRLKQKLTRGHIYLNMSLSNQQCFQTVVQPSLGMAKSHVDALRRIQEHCQLPGAIQVSDLLHIPGIFSTQDAPVNDKVRALIFEGFDQTIEALRKIRRDEGTSLLVDLQNRTHTLQQTIEKIKKLFEVTARQRQEEITQKLERLGENQELAAQQRALLYQELDRMDLNEEIVRFQTHLQAWSALLSDTSEEKGRKLDFLLQELGREINTVAAKCADSAIGQHAIAIKVELEKCREQIQNIV